MPACPPRLSHPGRNHWAARVKRSSSPRLSSPISDSVSPRSCTNRRCHPTHAKRRAQSNVIGLMVAQTSEIIRGRAKEATLRTYLQDELGSDVHENS